MPTVRRHKRSRTVMHKYDYDRLTKNLVVFVIWLAVLLIPISYYGARYFHGLSSEMSIDMAQVAKQEALGRGFVSGYAQPALMTLTGQRVPAPDIIHPPLYIWVLSFFRGVREGNDGSVSLCSSIFFVFSGILVFQFTRRHSGFSQAIVVSIIYLLNITLLNAAISGLPYTLTAFLFMLVCFLISLDTGKSFLISFFIGMVTGALYLSDYHFLPTVLPVAFCILLAHPKDRWRFFALFLIGFSAVSLPWILRNYRMGLNPLIGLPLKYRMIMGTPLLAEELTFGRFGLAKFEELYTHAAVYKKLIENLLVIYRSFFHFGGVWVIMAFIASFFVPSNGLGRVRAIVYVTIVLVVLFIALDDESVSGMTPLLPMIILLAVIGIYKVVDNATAIPDNIKVWVIRIFIAINIVPFIGAVVADPNPTSKRGDIQKSKLVITELGCVVGGREVILTDEPWRVSWYSGIPSVLLPEKEEDYKLLIANAGDFKFAYLTTRVVRKPMKIWSTIFKSRSVPAWFPLSKGHVLSDKSLLLSDKKRW